MSDLTFTEKILLVSYIMILPCFIVAFITMNGNILLYSLGFCGMTMCVNGVVEGTRSE